MSLRGPRQLVAIEGERAVLDLPVLALVGERERALPGALHRSALEALIVRRLGIRTIDGDHVAEYVDPQRLPGHARELAARVLLPPTKRRAVELPLRIRVVAHVEHTGMDARRELRRSGFAHAPDRRGRRRLLVDARDARERPLHRALHIGRELQRE